MALRNHECAFLCDVGRATNSGAHAVDEGAGHPSLRRPLLVWRTV